MPAQLHTLNPPPAGRSPRHGSIRFSYGLGVQAIYRPINALSTKTRSPQDFSRPGSSKYTTVTSPSGASEDDPDGLKNKGHIGSHPRPIDVLQVHLKLFGENGVQVELFPPLLRNGAQKRLFVEEMNAGRVGQPRTRLQDSPLLRRVVRDVSGKLGEYLGWGVPQVWIVDPDRQTVTVYRSLTDVAVFASDDTLTAGEILPGFSLKVAALFS